MENYEKLYNELKERFDKTLEAVVEMILKLYDKKLI